MNRIVLMSSAAVVLLLGSACGADVPAAVPPAMTESASTAAAPAPTESAPAAATPTPTQSATPAGNSTEVVVTLADNTIASSLTAFKVGVPYTFVITNTGRHEHSFSINEPIAITGSLDASLSSALLDIDQNDIPFGVPKTVQYTFDETAIGETLEFACLIRRHYDVGMRLAITVTN